MSMSTLNPAQRYTPFNPANGSTREPYRLEQEIGRSQTASLYRAIEVKSGRTVAFKVFQRRVSADPRFAIRFREYMKAVLDIDYQNLVTVLDYGVDDGRHFIATEWVDGPDLAAYLADHGALSAPETVYIGRQVCAALEAVHRGGLLHRNLKPQNILLDAGGLVKVSDAGLSGLLSESGLTRTHVMLGRFNYIAPEQVRGQAIGVGSDLYSLGVLLFEMLTNHTPFESRDAWEVMRMHVEAEPPSPNQYQPEVPDALSTIVLRALQKDPKRRFQSAAEMNEALSALVAHGAPDTYGLGDLSGSVSRPRKSSSSKATFTLREAWQFLHAPLPARILGRQVSFGFILLLQFLLTFGLAFAALYLLTGLN
jgi:eukaryotic-like serine/threonine-protein kinase